MPSSEESSSTTSELLHPYGYSTVISNVKKQRPNAIWMDINARRMEEAFRTGQMNQFERLDYIEGLRQKELQRKEAQIERDRNANAAAQSLFRNIKYDNVKRNGYYKISG